MRKSNPKNWNREDGTPEDGSPVEVIRSATEYNTPKNEMKPEDWQKINNCCGPVERIEWAEGWFIYRCSECGRTRAMEHDEIVTWKKI